MKIKNYTISSATKNDDYKSTTLWKSCVDYDLGTTFATNNTKSLAKVYNAAIEMALDNNSDCLVLIHDDVWLEHDPIPKLERLFDQYDLVGVAGCKKADINSPALWHLMGGGFQSGNLHGAVAHGSPNNKYVSSFGPIPQRVLMIDGVFMALNRKVMENMRFDEENPAKFHFYDLDFSLNCHKNGYRVGVGDIFITHESPGLREFSDEWKLGEKWFLSKYES